jgi:hypothetical protein
LGRGAWAPGAVPERQIFLGWGWPDTPYERNPPTTRRLLGLLWLGGHTSPASSAAWDRLARGRRGQEAGESRYRVATLEVGIALDQLDGAGYRPPVIFVGRAGRPWARLWAGTDSPGRVMGWDGQPGKGE